MQAPNVQQVGDLLVDIETGEVVGSADPQFRVRDRETAEWVLRKLADDEAELVALEARKKMLLANLDSMIADVRRHKDSLERRFSDELQAFAERELEGKKIRTLKTAYGRLAFKKVPARLVIEDEERVVAYFEQVAPEHVVVKRSVPIAEVNKVLGTYLRPEVLEPLGVKLIAERDSFRIDLGLGK